MPITSEQPSTLPIKSISQMSSEYEDLYQALLNARSANNGTLSIPVADRKTKEDFLSVLKASGFFSLYTDEKDPEISEQVLNNQRYIVVSSNSLLRTLMFYPAKCDAICKAITDKSFNDCFIWIAQLKNNRFIEMTQETLEQLSAWAFCYSSRFITSNSLDELQEKYKTFCTAMKVNAITAAMPVKQPQNIPPTNTIGRSNMTTSNNNNAGQADQQESLSNVEPPESVQTTLLSAPQESTNRLSFYDRLYAALKANPLTKIKSRDRSSLELKIKLNNGETKDDFINHLTKEIPLFWGQEEALKTATSVEKNKSVKENKIDLLIKGRSVSNVNQWVVRITKINEIAIPWMSPENSSQEPQCLARVFVLVEKLRMANGYKTGAATIQPHAKDVYDYTKKMIDLHYSSDKKAAALKNLEDFYSAYCDVIRKNEEIGRSLKKFDDLLKPTSTTPQQDNMDVSLGEKPMVLEENVSKDSEYLPSPQYVSAPITHTEDTDNDVTDEEPMESDVEFAELTAITERKRKLEAELENTKTELNKAKEQKKQKKAKIADAIVSSRNEIERKISQTPNYTLTVFAWAINTPADEEYKNALLKLKSNQLTEQAEKAKKAERKLDRIIKIKELTKESAQIQAAVGTNRDKIKKYENSVEQFDKCLLQLKS